MRSFDIVVIGAGVAGLTAAAQAAGEGLSVAVVERMGAGGQIMNVDHVRNFPGYPEGISGYELGPLLQERAEAAGVEFVLDTVERVEVDGDHRVVHGADESLRASAVIVAAGSERKHLGIPGEDTLRGRGVSHCASCDGPLFRGRKVCVVGGGDSALDEARVLAMHAGTVTVVHRGPSFNAQQSLVDELNALANVEVRFDTVAEEILGEGVVTGIRLRHLPSGETRVHEAEGVFVYVGLEPNSEILDGVATIGEGGRLWADAAMQSSVPGIFVAGDIREGSQALLASCADDGLAAAISACRHVRDLQARAA